MSVFAEFRAVVESLQPRIALVLGSGLGAIPRTWSPSATIAFRDLPGFPTASVAGHKGAVAVGVWDGLPLLVFQGRLHYYEGHGWATIEKPVRLMHDLGIHTLLLTNAAGGIRADLAPGSLMQIHDHRTWLAATDWHAELLPSVYSPLVGTILHQAAAATGTPLASGVYGALTGPCYETPAEIRALQRIGADAVGMSTAHEARTAHSLGMRVGAISCITNRAAGLPGSILDHHDVLATAAKQAERFSTLLECAVKRLAANESPRTPPAAPTVIS